MGAPVSGGTDWGDGGHFEVLNRETLSSKHRRQLRDIQRFVRKLERAIVAHLARRVKKRRQRSPAEARTDADAPHAQLAEFLHRQRRRALQPHQHIHRLCAREAQTVRMSSGRVIPGAYRTSAPGLLKRLQAADRVVQVRAAVKKVLCACHKHEQETAMTCAAAAAAAIRSTA